MRIASGTNPSPVGTEAAFLEKRRQYNREYMRARRANPDHKLNERQNRERSEYERKRHAASAAKRTCTNGDGKSVCGLCGQRPSVVEVVRLEICETARAGYVEVRMPYCGQC
jgi:hypothetical protein